MNDPRAARLAELLVDYSLELRPGELVRIDAATVAAPLVAEVYRAALRAGAHPYTKIELEDLAPILYAEASDEQVDHVVPTEHDEVERLDAMVTIWADRNTRSLSQADPEKMSRRLAARRPLSNRFWDRIAAGEARWVGTRFPTEAQAQDAQMSLAEYEDFVYGACRVRAGDEPVGYWRGLSTELRARATELEAVRELRILGPDTDLRLVVADRRWLAADGKLNMPDGEIFTSPVETETEGTVRFTYPAIYNGRAVEDVRLRFERGEVVEASASVGEDYLRSLIAMDAGSRRLGELAFGLNYEIDRFTCDILFDEKIGGTVHMALGSGFKQLGGINDSGLHWDLICDLRAEGEVYADGELVWKAGRFVQVTDPVEAVAAR
jgi:aminopeptidase